VLRSSHSSFMEPLIPVELKCPLLKIQPSQCGRTWKGDAVAIGTVHLAASAALASVLFDAMHGIPIPPLIPSQSITAGPHGEVTLKFLNLMLSQTAFGFVEHVNFATAVPYLPLE
jgi:hypothetical protein